MQNLQKITYPCSIDNSLQPAYQLLASGTSPRPLLVALHTWSGNYENGIERYVDLCRQKNWHLIYPNFRGPNNTPDACGSDLVTVDIGDAAIFMQKNFLVDPSRIYLSGGSGGGHATLLVAGRYPEIWAAASAWCPISDIAAWHRECLDTRHQGYADHIELACGGNPTTHAKAWSEALKRSPLTYLKNAANLPLDINTGIHDGHTGSVPISQAIHAYNLLANRDEQIAQQDIDWMLAEEKVPKHLRWLENDPAFGTYLVYLRKQSKRVRLTLFEGGHDLLIWPALDWLERQKKGQQPDWTPGKPNPTSASGNNELSR
ncbi:MAG: prolyl oligopeptidase family serine peptidase [Lentisphaeria bacterium]